jgi:hypothetical protein
MCIGILLFQVEWFLFRYYLKKKVHAHRTGWTALKPEHEISI